jgi:hypothetical protein
VVDGVHGSRSVRGLFVSDFQSPSA